VIDKVAWASVGPSFDTVQGHETNFPQLIAEWFGVEHEDVKLITGDTDLMPVGGGTASGRSMRLGAVVMAKASDQIVEKGRRFAASLLEAEEPDIEFARPRLTVTGTTAPSLCSRLLTLNFAHRQAGGSGEYPGEAEVDADSQRPSWASSQSLPGLRSRSVSNDAVTTAAESMGHAIISSATFVHPADGSQTVVSSGGNFQGLIGIAVAANGDLLVVDFDCCADQNGAVNDRT
jgi:hypothetical protein